MRRCQWATMGNSPLMVEYHDKEWGVPVHDDRTLFEFLVLEGVQAGLSWQTVLNKRENYRKAFHAFEPTKIARYTNKDVQRLLRDPGIIRNRLKIQATINNAKQILGIRKEFDSFDKYIWGFVGGKPIKHRFESLNEIPATTRQSDAMSKDLRKRGPRCVGHTICYPFMQAVGRLSTHPIEGYRYATGRPAPPLAAKDYT